MQIKKCDRCGAEITEIIELPLQQMILPRYSIKVTYSINNIVDVDLCDKCQRDFEKWLHGDSECERNES